MNLSPAQQRGLAWCAWVTSTGPMVDQTPTRATLRALAARGLVRYAVEVTYPRTATGHQPRRPVAQVTDVTVLPAGRAALNGGPP